MKAMAMKNYYLRVHKQCAKHTIFRGSGGMPLQEFWKISAIRLNLEAILAKNYVIIHSLKSVARGVTRPEQARTLPGHQAIYCPTISTESWLSHVR